jgi:hypothetical protein
MIDEFAKEHLHGHLRSVREALVWKLDGLGEYDFRRPLTSTGTNLLGLVKHLAVWESRYFGEVFARPFPEPLPRWDDEAANDAAFWAADILREQIDGTVGMTAKSTPLHGHDSAFWAARHATIEQAARAADGASAPPQPRDGSAAV